MDVGDQEIRDLLNTERDTFRLVIRGHAAIDKKLDDLLRDALIGPLPDFLKRRSFRDKLQLARALGLIHGNYIEAVGRLTTLRNDLSHGKIPDVDLARSVCVARGVTAFAPQLGLYSTYRSSPETRALLWCSR